MFDLVLDKALEKCGSSKALAIELGKTPPDITKFRGGDIGFKLAEIEKLLEIAGLKIEPANKDEQQREKEQRLKAAMEGLMVMYLDKV